MAYAMHINIQAFRYNNQMFDIVSLSQSHTLNKCIGSLVGSMNVIFVE